jgi:aminomethyltransferase
MLETPGNTRLTPPTPADRFPAMPGRTPFYDFHTSAGAKIVDFAGWEMPILYRGIVEEHLHTRRAASVFDVSHMGRLEFTGTDAERFLNHLLTRNVSKMQTGQSRYALVCNHSGGVLDDIIVSRFADKWLIVCNASNREKLLGHIEQVRHDEGFEVKVMDQTEATAMIAVQGPKAVERLESALPVNISQLKRYGFEAVKVMTVEFTVFRSGYTGEDGAEIIMPAGIVPMALQVLDELEEGEEPVLPAGLGARDTLRLEAGMPLYGHELTDQTDPLSAGLGWAVDLEKQFIGADALRKIQQQGPPRKLVGLVLEGRRIARQGAAVLSDGRPVGEVTSGTFGPTVQKSIAMAYVDVHEAVEGGELEVDLKGSKNRARVVKLPFYSRGK